MHVNSMLIAGLRALIAATLALGIAAGSAMAQGQPTSVNPTASSVNEQKLLDALKPGSSSTLSGRVSIPDQNSRNLIQPGGKDWRETHEGTMPRVGAIAILGMTLLVAIFYLVRGRIRITDGFSGHTILRFGGLDRFAHWLTAVSFIVLGLSGLNLTFGKGLLLPIVGPEAFAILTQAGKFAHNYVSFPFVLGLVLMLLLWLKDNIPLPRDITWLAQGGGLVGRNHPPAGRFNGGQKLIFWAVILGGAALAYTGYQLMFPLRYTDLAGMQQASIIHGLLGAILVAIIVAHIYIGSLGMEGAFDAMGTGKVDANWAKEHHSVWVEQVAAKDPSALTPQGKASPAE